jgi:hypothetical protein
MPPLQTLLNTYPNNSATKFIRRCNCWARNRYSDRFLIPLVAVTNCARCLPNSKQTRTEF